MNCNSKISGSAEGDRRKVEALAMLAARREVYIRRGRRALLDAMLAGNGTATADDVQAAVELPSGIDPRCLGSVPGRLAYDGLIEAAGFTRSTRPETHSRWVQVWRLADRAAAEQWLQERPDVPDLGADDAGAAIVQRPLFATPQEAATPVLQGAGAAR